MADAYHIVHLTMSSASDTATIQNWLDTNVPLSVVWVFVNGLNVYILYT